MTHQHDSRTSFRGGIAQAIYESRNGAGAVPWGKREAEHKAPYLRDADAAIAYLRSRHAIHLDDLQAIKAEEARK